MPFLSEELYQRLPRRPDHTVTSICVSPYPENVSVKHTYHTTNIPFSSPFPSVFISLLHALPHCHPQLGHRDQALEEKVKLVQEVVRTIRSLKQDYLPAKAKPEGKGMMAGHSTCAGLSLTPL